MQGLLSTLSGRECARAVDSRGYDAVTECGKLFSLLSNNQDACRCTNVAFLKKRGSRTVKGYDAEKLDLTPKAAKQFGATVSHEISRKWEKAGGTDEVVSYDSSLLEGKSYYIERSELIDQINLIDDAIGSLPSTRDLSSICKDATIQRCDFEYSDGMKYRAYSLVKSQASFLRKKRLFSLREGMIESAKEEFLVLQACPDVIEYQDTLMFFNRKTFEKIFDYEEMLKSFVNSNVDAFISTGLFCKPEAFANACLNSERRAELYKRVVQRGVLRDLTCNRNQIQTVRDEYRLDIPIKDDVIDFSAGCTSKQADDVIRLLSHFCVTDALTGLKMFAAEIDTYDVDRVGDS